MDRGIYTASSGGLAAARRLDLVGHNLANVNTVGFKAERLLTRQQEFSDTLAGVLPKGVPARAEADQNISPGVVNAETVTDFSPGPVSFTGNGLNVALEKPNHFFVVRTPQGDAYTRAGNFVLDSEGNVTSPDGMPVQGEGGPIVVNGGNPSITSNGTVLVNGQPAGRLRVVEFDDLKGLKRAEGVRFLSSGGAQPRAVDAQVVPASLEMANISVVEAMVDMINAQKSFESYAKTVQTINELNEGALRTSRSV